MTDNKKTFILDASVLLHNPQSLFMFEEHDVVIPLSVIVQLDRFKQGNQEMNRTARHVINEIDRLRQKHSLSEGVVLPGGGCLKVINDELVDLGQNFTKDRLDSKLALAYQLHEQGFNVVVLSKNLSIRITADAMGLEASDLLKDKVDLIYKGWHKREVGLDVLTTIEEDKRLAVDSGTYQPNEFRVLTCADSKEADQVLKLNPQENYWVPLRRSTEAVVGISPRNTEQEMAIELLMNPRISLVTLVGAAGTGKTLLAMACGLKQILDEHAFLKMLVTRPIVPVGKDIGYLPGSKEKKLGHWMQPIFDNLDVILNSNDRLTRENITYFMESDMLELEALTYMRGRSLPRQFMIIDEAQNLTPHEIKTIISRAGQKTKIVLTGDPYQIDNPYLDASTNGLTYVIERLKQQKSFGHVTLEKSERSALAALAVEFL